MTSAPVSKSHMSNTSNRTNEWPMVRLGDHATKIGSGLTPSGGHASYQKTGIPLIRSQNVHMNRFSLDGLAFISASQDAEMAGTRVIPGDVLLNITGASIGRVCVVPAELTPANVNQHVMIIRSDHSWHPQFIAFFLSSPAFQKMIWDDQAGATRQALTKALIENFSVPLPPLPEQQRIAAFLTARLAAVDRARLAAAQQLAAAAMITAASLRERFCADEILGCKQLPLGDLVELLPAKSIASDGDAEVQAVTTACLTETGFVDRGIKPARMRSSDVSACILGRGEILIARSNTPDLVGRVAMYMGQPSPIVASDLTIRMHANSEDLGLYLTDYLSYLYLSGYWKEKAGGASGSMKKITREQIKTLPVPMPDQKLCRTVHSAISTIRSNSQNLISHAENQLAAISALPDAVLREAFS